MIDSIRYTDWLEAHGAILAKLRGKRVLLTYSGGKDSSVALYLLHRASSEFQFGLEVHNVLFPQHVYPDHEIERLRSYWKTQGVTIHWHDGMTPDAELEHSIGNGLNPCSVCNRTKKEVLVKEGRRILADPESMAVVMGYSLWDLVSSTAEHLLGAFSSAGQGAKEEVLSRSDSRFLETAQRFYPLIRLNNGLQIFKPLIRYNDQEIKGLIETLGIPISGVSCRYCAYRPKRHFAAYYEKAGLRFDFESVFAFAKKVQKIPDLAYFQDLKMNTYFESML